MSRVGVAILGGTGYGAGETLRLLTHHPTAEVVCVVSSGSSGRAISEAHPHLRGFYDGTFADAVDWDRLCAFAERVVVSAQPNAVSGRQIAELAPVCRERGVRIIDLSGDLRLTDTQIHRQHYPDTPTEQALRREVVYGLPELFRDRLRDATLVANPGCLATACILSAAPFVSSVSTRIFFDAKTGSSGAGRSPRETTHHPVRHSNFFAYKPLTHQHEPEIVQALSRVAGSAPECAFVPQSMAVSRGIYVTAHLNLDHTLTASAAAARIRDFYSGSPFVRVCDAPPELQNVVGSNFCDIGVAARGRDLVVMAALDNLIKGMCGTAIQNLNLMCGLPETTGLWHPAWRPV